MHTVNENAYKIATKTIAVTFFSRTNLSCEVYVRVKDYYLFFYKKKCMNCSKFVSEGYKIYVH